MHEFTGGIDNRAQAVVGRANQEAAILNRAHSSNQQMLGTRGCVAKVTIVRKIHQHIRARCRKLPHQIRKRRLVTNENSEFLRSRRKNLDSLRLEQSRQLLE